MNNLKRWEVQIYCEDPEGFKAFPATLYFNLPRQVKRLNERTLDIDGISVHLFKGEFSEPVLK